MGVRALMNVSGTRVGVLVFGCVLLAAGETRVAAQSLVSDTVHNLAVSGPGQVKAQAERQVCIFCHAPHNTAGEQPLWNRGLSAASYQIYQSSTLDANVGQPTGSSKLCLSCHDGTIALGSVLTRAARIAMSGGDYIPAGLTNLGTDLSDDHPISFFYTSGLAASDQQLASPAALPDAVKLDQTGQLQCTSCHDPHDNSEGDFMVMKHSFGALCTACHQMDGWSVSAHRSSGAVVTGVPAGDWPFNTVAENACRSCHRAHTAAGRERLLIHELDEDNCLVCHDGQVASHNIRSELDKFFSHDPQLYLDQHDPIETYGSTQAHVECADCHNPHAVEPVPPTTTGYVPIGPTLSEVPGISQAGAYIRRSQHEYEVCYRCHSDGPVQISNRIARLADSDNMRLEFATTNVSYHPVVGSSPSPDTVSLIPGMPTGSLVRCTDCHNNDSGPRANGTGPDGPHGSIYDFLLERNYTTGESNVESATEYALCYKCHQRSSILSDNSFKEHSKHIEGEDTPCSICHDPHGVRNTAGSSSDHTHLINFDTRWVQPSPGNGPIRFEDRGVFAGSCTLVCHGEDHNNENYP